MVSVFAELIVSEESAKDQLFNWKHDTRGKKLLSEVLLTTFFVI